MTAVDSAGSMVFGSTPKKRCIPKLGSGKRTPIIENAIIDDVIIAEESEGILACSYIFDKYGYLLGCSSGSVFSAIKKYFKGKTFIREPNVVCVCR